jgi:hypothetical protein
MTSTDRVRALTISGVSQTNGASWGSGATVLATTSSKAGRELGRAQRNQLEAVATADRTRAVVRAAARSGTLRPAERRFRRRPHWWPRLGLRWRVA